jgi:avirulence protein
MALQGMPHVVQLAQLLQARTALPRVPAAAAALPPRRPAPPHRAHLNQTPVSRLPADAQQLIGVARWPDPVHNREHVSAQQRYGQYFSDASVALGRHIASGRIPDMTALWADCRTIRHTMARAAGDPSVQSFAQPRDGGLATPIGGRYGYMHERTLRSIYQSIRQPKAQVRVSSDPAPLPATDSSSNTCTRTLQCTTTLAGQTRGLTKMRVAIAGTDRARLLTEDTLPIVRQAFGKMVHTHPMHIPALMARAEEVFQATLKPGLSSQRRLAGLAEMHWLLTQATPDWRGSAAKAEMAVRAMAHAMDMELPPLRRGIQADLEAFITPKDAFIDKYSGFFDTPA